MFVVASVSGTIEYDLNAHDNKKRIALLRFKYSEFGSRFGAFKKSESKVFQLPQIVKIVELNL